ncbi:MAG: threonine/serine exporter family protein [Erysipelotrichaceae bacterium]|nr:threonine/serine exporter family protein [Erysipelotrichaceae bacterium]
MMLQTLGAFFATLGFGVMFNIRGDKLYAAAFGGALGYFIYDIFIKAGLGEPLSLFIASAGFTAYAEALARKLKTPVTLFIVCALIILVPGGGMYRTMLAIIQGNLDSAVQIGLSSLASAGSLALGTIFTSTLSRALFSLKKKG